MRLLFDNLQKGVAAAERHLHSYQIANEEIIYAWLKVIHHVVHWFFVTNGEPDDKEKLLQYEIPDACRQHVENFVDELKQLPLWVNKDLSISTSGGRQNGFYWQSTFESGKTPDGTEIMPTQLTSLK